MNVKRFNWQIWVGFLLSVLAFLSYPTFFVRFPVTRDFPWANLLLGAMSFAFILIGLRRAFSPSRRLFSKIVSLLVATVSVLIMGMFVFVVFVQARWLPASKAAPQVGQKVPEFSLPDTRGQVVSLSELIATPVNGKVPKGVLLIFYRGYW